jgi:hypothetical protein
MAWESLLGHRKSHGKTPLQIMAEIDGLEKQLLEGYWPLKEAKQKGRPVKAWLGEI